MTVKMQPIPSSAHVKTAHASQDKLAKIRTVTTIVSVTTLKLCFTSGTHPQQDFIGGEL